MLWVDNVNFFYLVVGVLDSKAVLDSVNEYGASACLDSCQDERSQYVLIQKTINERDEQEMQGRSYTLTLRPQHSKLLEFLRGIYMYSISQSHLKYRESATAELIVSSSWNVDR